MYFDVGLVLVPPRASVALSSDPQLLGQERCNQRFPGRVPACGWRLVAEGEPPLQEHLRQVAQAQRVAQPPEDDRNTMSVGTLKSLKEVPLRSLQRRVQAAHRNVR